VVVLPLGEPPWTSHCTHTLRAVELSDETEAFSHGRPNVSFRSPVDDQVSIVVLEGGLEYSG